jgi:hypothetical protein
VGVRCLAGIAASLLLAAIPRHLGAQEAGGHPNVAPNLRDLGAAISRYYEKPVDLPRLLADWEQAGGPARDSMMGFLAGLFAKQPEQIKIATAAKLGRPAQAAVIQGLRLAGRHPEAIAAAKSWDWSAEQMAPITPLRPLGEVKPTQPGSFDIFWAASFATGDEAYVRPIYDYYDTVASTADVDVQDIVAIVTLRARRDRAGLEAIKQKYPDATFRRVVNASSALWSLESNARQHKFVASALDRYVKEKPGSPAIEGLAELRKAVASARPAR